VAIGWPVIGKLMVVLLIQIFLALHYLVESYPEPAESGSCFPAVFMCHKCKIIRPINLLTPNVNYSGRTAPLTSKVAFYIFIQQI